MIRINLLPVRAKRKQEAVQRHLVFFVAGLSILLLGGGGFYKSKVSHRDTVLAKNTQIQQEIESLKKIIGEVEAYKKQQELLARKLEVIRNLKANKTGPVHMLDELATRIPDKLWLSSLSEMSGKITLEGVSINQEVIATFMTRLEESEYFKDVYLITIQAQEQQGFKLKQFTVTARLVVPGVVRAEG